jgi:hypothetical protein
MWEKTEINIKNVNYVCYKNNDPRSEVKELLFSVSNIGYFECIISFATFKFADQFFDEFTEICPVYINDPYSSDEYATTCCKLRDEDLMLSHIKFDLSQQKESDLEKIHTAFSFAIDTLPEEGLAIIKANPRQLSDLEKTFYETLPNVAKDNFSILLEMATNIVVGCNANALWELAQSCKDAPIILIEEWIQTLKCIKLDSNYYTKAAKELAYFTLADYDSESSITIGQQRAWITKGLTYAFGMGHGGEDVMKKMTLTLLGENWSEQDKIFPTRPDKEDEEGLCYVTDLLMYTKFLHEENTKLKQEQGNTSKHNSLTTLSNNNTLNLYS